MTSQSEFFVVGRSHAPAKSGAADLERENLTVSGSSKDLRIRQVRERFDFGSFVAPTSLLSARAEVCRALDLGKK